MPVIPAAGKLRQDDCELETILGFIDPVSKQNIMPYWDKGFEYELLIQLHIKFLDFDNCPVGMFKHVQIFVC